jgi:hypothetical protein
MPVRKFRLLQVNKIEMLNVVKFHVYLSFTFLALFIYTVNTVTTRIMTQFRGGLSSFHVKSQNGCAETLEFTSPDVPSS